MDKSFELKEICNELKSLVVCMGIIQNYTYNISELAISEENIKEFKETLHDTKGNIKKIYSIVVNTYTQYSFDKTFEMNKNNPYPPVPLLLHKM